MLRLWRTHVQKVRNVELLQYRPDGSRDTDVVLEHLFGLLLGLGGAHLVRQSIMRTQGVLWMIVPPILA